MVKRKKYKALICDIDGTLIINSREALPSKNVVHAIKKASKIVHIGIATSRPLFVTQHLIELNHRRIGCITGPSNLTPSADRIIGYRRALEQANLSVDESLIIPGDFHIESGYAATLRLLNLPDPPTAIFAFNDLMAVGAMHAASQAGVEVPRDLSIVGFDDIELASYVTPALTTVKQPTMEMGKKAVQLLIERIEDKDIPTRCHISPTELIIRDSSGQNHE